MEERECRMDGLPQVWSTLGGRGERRRHVGKSSMSLKFYLFMFRVAVSRLRKRGELIEIILQRDGGVALLVVAGVNEREVFL